VNSIIWNKDEKITAYDKQMDNLKNMMTNRDNAQLDDPQTIVDAIAAQATGESKQFRTVIGEAGNGLLALRNSVPIEQYLETIANNYK
jgi:hypothetical protein